MSIRPGIALVLFAGGLLLTGIATPALVSALRRSGSMTENYRGARVLRPLGLLLPICVVGAIALSFLLTETSALARLPLSYITVVSGFAFLGYLDDVHGDRTVGGFKGHLTALREGRITTGLVKALGGLLVALWASWLLGQRGIELAVSAVPIALFANIVNLLDLRPGRALKVFFAVAALLWLLSPDGDAWLLWPAILPPAVVLFVLDLREIGMLGDTGSNALGGLLGLTFVVNSSWQVQLLGALLLAVTTLASELYSFSKAVERNRALSWLDSLGRRSTTGKQGGKRER
ncbi:MAG: hypothetical protein C4521_06025 [Actinobacteria bacterium]|nr:MAG: hypothetical protein C4521_06025 [Actinomycetota bacterium]